MLVNVMKILHDGSWITANLNIIISLYCTIYIALICSIKHQKHFQVAHNHSKLQQQNAKFCFCCSNMFNVWLHQAQLSQTASLTNPTFQ